MRPKSPGEGVRLANMCPHRERQETVKQQDPPGAAFGTKYFTFSCGVGEEAGDRKASWAVRCGAHLNREGVGCGFSEAREHSFPFSIMGDHRTPFPASGYICITHLHLKGAHRLEASAGSAFL